jgi:small-conductance mechanosensitive channel
VDRDPHRAYILRHILPPGGFLSAAIKAIAWIAWLGVALHITGLLPGVIEGLDDIGLTVGKDKQRITLWLVLQALAALAFTLAVAAWISRITETRVLASRSWTSHSRGHHQGRRVTALFVGVLVALPLVGIPITALSVFGGALAWASGSGCRRSPATT